MIKEGFKYEGKRIYFIDGEGKDISFERWRATLYYEPNYAVTVFFDTPNDYNMFLQSHDSQCYKDYTDFVKDWRDKHD